jgi:3-oxoacyl-[acyl-carrier protein] reductase
MKLTGKVALITNVSHFMGPAITEEFCREGASVALHDREPALIKPFATIAERLGRDVLALGGDLSRSAEAERAVEAVVARFGRLDILVNNNAHPPSGSPSSRSPTRPGARCSPACSTSRSSACGRRCG